MLCHRPEHETGQSQGIRDWETLDAGAEPVSGPVKRATHLAGRPLSWEDSVERGEGRQFGTTFCRMTGGERENEGGEATSSKDRWLIKGPNTREGFKSPETRSDL